jgi:hypothetical protein
MNGINPFSFEKIFNKCKRKTKLKKITKIIIVITKNTSFIIRKGITKINGRINRIKG